MHKKWMLLMVVVGLLLGSLACNFPGAPSFSSGVATPTPEVYVTVLVVTATADATPVSTEIAATATLSVTVTPTATATLTPTATPSGPTPTPTLAPPGPALVFLDPGWELKEWHEASGTGEWEGVIKVNVDGGVPPYRVQLENQEIVAGLELPARWRLCKVMPATVRVWSADGQEASSAIWIGELGCQP